MPAEVEPTPKQRHRRWPFVVGVVVCVAFLLGIWPRVRNRQRVRQLTTQMAVPSVMVVLPQRDTKQRQVVLPGNVLAYSDSPIFSRSQGYLRRWLVDIGARVKKGQVLALVAAPDIDAQVEQARHLVMQAQAALQLSQQTATRYAGLRVTNAVSQQDVDNTTGALQANQANVEAARANLQHLLELQEFERIRAPFDGIISLRNVDVGDLINIGSSSVPGTELFHIVQSTQLRVYIEVPEADAVGLTPGLAAELSFNVFPGRMFHGTLVRTADAVTPSTRTLRIEVLVDNPTGTLLAGAYAQVRLVLPPRETLTLPVSALLFRRDGLHVAAVEHDGHVQMKQVTAGHDFGETIEIVAGLTGSEQVVDNPSDSITTGDHVQIATSATQARAPSP